MTRPWYAGLLVVFSVLPVPLSVIAAGDESVCREFIKRGAFDEFNKNTKVSSHHESRERLCETLERYQTGDTQIGGSAGPYEATYRSRDARYLYSLMCRDDYNLEKLDLESAESKRVLSDNARKVLEACLAPKRGVKIRPQFPSADIVTVDVWYDLPHGVPSNTTGRFNGPIRWSADLTCKTTPEKIDGATRIDNQAKNIECERKATALVRMRDDYGEYHVHRGGVISVPTSDGTFNIVFPDKYMREEPFNPQPIDLTFRVERSLNVCRACFGDGYGGLITDTLDASAAENKRPRRIVFETPVDANYGDYKLVVRYTSNEKRAATITVNGKPVRTGALSHVVGGWDSRNVIALEEAIVPIWSGVNTITFDREGPLPHIESARLIPLGM